MYHGVFGYFTKSWRFIDRVYGITKDIHVSFLARFISLLSSLNAFLYCSPSAVFLVSFARSVESAALFNTILGLPFCPDKLLGRLVVYESIGIHTIPCGLKFKNTSALVGERVFTTYSPSIHKIVFTISHCQVYNFWPTFVPKRSSVTYVRKPSNITTFLPLCRPLLYLHHSVEGLTPSTVYNRGHYQTLQMRSCCITVAKSRRQW